MDVRVWLTINALSQSFDYFGLYFLPDLVWPALVWPALLWPPPTHNWHKQTIFTNQACKTWQILLCPYKWGIPLKHTSRQSSFTKKYTPWNKAWANSSRKTFKIGRDPGAPHAPREELVIIALEEGSVEPKPREPLRRRRLRVEVNNGMGSRSTCRRLRTESLGL